MLILNHLDKRQARAGVNKWRGIRLLFPEAAGVKAAEAG